MEKDKQVSCTAGIQEIFSQSNFRNWFSHCYLDMWLFYLLSKFYLTFVLMSPTSRSLRLPFCRGDTYKARSSPTILMRSCRSNCAKMLTAASYGSCGSHWGLLRRRYLSSSPEESHGPQNGAILLSASYFAGGEQSSSKLGCLAWSMVPPTASACSSPPSTQSHFTHVLPYLEKPHRQPTVTPRLAAHQSMVTGPSVGDGGLSSATNVLYGIFASLLASNTDVSPASKVIGSGPQFGESEFTTEKLLV